MIGLRNSKKSLGDQEKNIEKILKGLEEELYDYDDVPKLVSLYNSHL